jgi:hypothetical protein
VPEAPEPDVPFPVEFTVKIVGESTTRVSSSSNRGR